MRVARRGGGRIAARRRDTGEAAAATLRKIPGPRVEFVQADVGEPRDCRAIIDRCEEVFGRVDGVVNSAADTSRGTLADTTPELWDRIHRVNLRGPFLVTQAAAALMRKAGVRGSVVNISSVHAHGGAPFNTPYAVSKGGLDNLTRLNARELQPHGIRVNAVNLGWTLTDQEYALQTKSAGNGWLAGADAGHPMGRLLRPGDAAGLVGFLLSDSSVMMTGSCIDLHPEAIAGLLPAGNGDL